jgi:hypothetical protein
MIDHCEEVSTCLNVSAEYIGIVQSNCVWQVGLYQVSGVSLCNLERVSGCEKKSLEKLLCQAEI